MWQVNRLSRMKHFILHQEKKYIKLNKAICIIIPTYNNDQTLAQVIDSVLKYLPSVIVVNDGSTDGTHEILKRYKEKLEIVSYEKNRGKGFAISRGFDRAEQLGYTHAITIDSDGQHYASDIPQFVKAAQDNPNALIVGSRNLTQNNMPKKNTFANKFSNFWFTVQTAHRLSDTQTGYRLYPLQKMKGLRPLTSRYEAELEILVRCAWRNIPIKSIPIQVFYAPEGKRVTHFRPVADFARISLLNTVFVILAIIYGYPSMMLRKATNYTN
jgi:glycosyltransferase involved in cell wall biosynthesis